MVEVLVPYIKGFVGNKILAYAIAYIGVTAVTSWALRALSPKPDFDTNTGLLANTRQATAPQEVVYGEIRKGGVVTFIESTGDTNQYLHQIICLAGHEVNAIGDIYINDEVVTWDSSTGLVTTSKWQDADGNSKIRIRKHLGADNQTADSDLVSETSVTSDFKGEGIAYLYVRMEYDQTVFAEGIPLFTAKVQGKKVYDPRTSTSGYSANAALCVRDYLVSSYGLDNTGVINDTVFQAAANTCDEDVTLSGSGTEDRYAINGVVRLDRTPSDILGDMMTACAGTLFWGQGNWQLKVGEYTSPVKTLTLDDFRSGIVLDTKHSRRDNFNIVRGTFIDASTDYIQTDYPEIRSSTFIANDNNIESALDLPLPFTTSSSMAQRLAKMTLFRAREEMTLTADFGLSAFNVQVGDVIAITNSRYGFSAKDFEVVGWKFKNDSDGGELAVALTLRETSSSAFSWSAEESDITSNDSTLTSPASSLTISSLTTSGGGRTTSDGTFVNSVIVSWTAPTNKFISHYEVEWKATADSNYASTTTVETSIELSPLVDAVEYIIRVRAVTISGAKGAFVTATFTGGGDTTAPALPTSISATGGFKYITISWTNPADADLNFVEIYENTVNTSSGATLVGISAGDTFTRTNLGLNETRYYFLKSVDYSGNKSAFTSGVSATTTYLDDNDFEDGVRQIFIDAGLDIIEPVSTLPASGVYVNQQVFLTTDQKLYVWNGTDWAEIVTDVAADSITATEIADGAISTPKLAANAVTAAKIQADTITGNKIAANTITSGLLATSGLITSAAQISNGIIERAKIKDLAVSTAKIGDNMVTFPQYSQGIQNTNLSISTGAETDVVSLTVNQTGAEAYIQVTLLVSHSDGSVVSSSKYGQATIKLLAGTTQIASYASVNVGGLNTSSILINHTHSATGNTTYKATVTPTGGNDTFYRVVDCTLFFVELKK